MLGRIPLIDLLRSRSRRGATEEELARGDRGVDRSWYLKEYPDVAAAGVDPVRHYLQFGWREGRDPRPDFSTAGYLMLHDGAERAGQNPLIHHLRSGSPPAGSDDQLAGGDRRVDRSWYLATYPGVAPPGEVPGPHYLHSVCRD